MVDRSDSSNHFGSTCACLLDSHCSSFVISYLVQFLPDIWLFPPGNLAHLACISAPSEFINFITYKARTFSAFITAVDNVRVYHCGPEYFAEVNVVLPPNIPLWEAHEIAQPLQDEIEKLKEVDRCFVHGEFEASNSVSQPFLPSLEPFCLFKEGLGTPREISA